MSALRSLVFPQSTGLDTQGTEPLQVAPSQVTGSVDKLGPCLRQLFSETIDIFGWLESLALTHCPGTELLIGPWVYECQLLFLITTFN